MTRRTLLFSSLAALAAPIPAAARRPNVLLILPDQLRAQALGYMGNSDVQTPHIDRLASQSVILPNTFANTPVCCPARANLLTGQYTHRNGMVANDLRFRESNRTLAEILSEAQYRTGFIGKWHLDGGPRLPGFVPPGPRRQGFQFWAANECAHTHFKTQYFRDSPTPIPITKFEPEAWTDLGIEFLQEQQKNPSQPFFLTIQMGPPHDPYNAPSEYARRYDPAKLTMRPNWREQPGLPGRKEIAQYYAAITAVDDQVGRLLKALDDTKFADSTIVVFCSDHGDMLGSQGLRLKRKPWEESIRVPGLIRYPATLKPHRNESFFTHVDFAPTMLGLCDLPVPADMQGTNLAAPLKAQTRGGPDSAFFQIFGPFQGDGTEGAWRGIRTPSHMYARWERGPWVLYDLQKDPYEQTNLAGRPEAQTIQAGLDKQLTAWMNRTGDSWKYDWTALVEDKGRLYNDRAFYTVDEYLEWAAKNGRQ